MTVKINDDGSLEYDSYVKRGNISYLREGLPISDPDHLYIYLKFNDVEPEKYGIFHPISDKYKDYTKEQLLSKVCELELAVKDMYKYI